MRKIDSSIRNRIINTFDYLIETDEERERYSGCIDAMWYQCIEKGAFGYSAHYEALIGEFTSVLEYIKPLVKTEDDFQRLCKAIPDILRWLPYTSEEGIMGYTHYIQMWHLKDRVLGSGSFDSFIAGFEEG